MKGSIEGDDASTVSLGAEEERQAPEGPHLLVIEGGASFRFCLPGSGEVVIGRAPGAQLRLSDPAASRHHARIDVSAEGARITDLDSHNGTRVNGERLRRPRPLLPGDTVFICGAILVFEAPPPAPPVGEGAVVRIAGREAIAADPATARLFTLIRRLAGSDLPVLITGETGTGKEIAALAVHDWSGRRTGPFMALNCAALPENLIESELFGYQKGAFSGAAGAKPGLLESAHLGVLLLDEVGELPLVAQAKLLRALETGRVLRLGEVRERPFDARILAATNRDLEAEARAGRFRQDLFFRLSAATVTVPPLRERRCDLQPLARAFLTAACDQARRAPMALSPAALERMHAYGWPGNVRELKHVMECAAVAVPEPVLLPCHLPERVRCAQAADAGDGEAGSPPARAFRPIQEEMRALERSRIQAALEATGGVQTQAAKLLGMPLRTFIKRMNGYGLQSHGRRGR